jgi:membrane-associated HD superfamily phosphohydrolase
MADNFDMKKFLVENKLGAYSKLKNEGEAAYEYEKGKAAGEKLAKEDLGKDLEDTKAADMMDFLAEDETNPKAKKELDAIQKQIVAAQSKLNSFRKVYKDKYNKASKEKQKQLDAALKAAEKDFEKTVTPLEAQSKKLKENKESLNEDASQTVIDILGILAGLAGMGLSGVQILRWQDKLEKENPELHKQLGKVSGAIGAADPSKNLEEKEEKEEGYMGTQYDSSEDMAVDMIKKGIYEKLSPEMTAPAAG